MYENELKKFKNAGNGDVKVQVHSLPGKPATFAG